MNLPWSHNDDSRNGDGCIPNSVGSDGAENHGDARKQLKLPQ